MRLSLVRLAFLCFKDLPEELRRWASKIGDVAVDSLGAHESSEAIRLLIAATIELRYPPKVTSNGLLVVPKRERQDAEDAIEIFGNLIAVAGALRRRISSPTPCIALIRHDDEAKTLLEGRKGWLRELSTQVHLRAYTSLDQKAVGGLNDRLDGVALLAEALSHDQPIGKYRDLVRLFERAFALSGNKLSVPLLEFLGAGSLGYTDAEIESWVRLRDPATHADQRNEIVFEADVRHVIARMEQAAYDVLLNKADWRKPSAGRRQYRPLESGTKSAGGAPHLFFTQRTPARVEGQLLDPFGSYPQDLGGTLTSLPDPAWWTGPFVDAPRGDTSASKSSAVCVEGGTAGGPEGAAAPPPI